VDKHGWIALGLGTFFSLLIGGLMALMFSSSLGKGESRPPSDAPFLQLLPFSFQSVPS
jgi:hypothetical protein